MSESTWMTCKDVLALLPIKKSAFEKLVAERKVPRFTKFGRDRYWKSDEIQAWIESCRQ